MFICIIGSLQHKFYNEWQKRANTSHSQMGKNEITSNCYIFRGRLDHIVRQNVCLLMTVAKWLTVRNLGVLLHTVTITVTNTVTNTVINGCVVDID